ncbi:MAG: GNAT family N-acetyltransferase [Acinetobacter sp. GWC1_38_13]|uniref:GNAT family N-acetyltransferase n=1 Tax=Acinetobacter sp. GWC1_38_13 TaxID=1797234 RepID=UPI0008B947F1|nr:GNAT family N-acetyltransferase [Acinetobacter sp. GWC1_38_13]OFW44109.1 MAG: GNAT family N-acetyltransferase [Acinetobacter sp. GWC1_38_13]HAV56900.1 GNAT family N-acetyltransferase [Acinetobacter junii]
MHVRAATLKDIETLVDFGKRLTKESPIFSKQGFSESGAREVFGLLIRRYGSIFIVSDEYSNPVGAVIGAINSDWRTGHKIAFEQGVYVLPEYRRSNAAKSLIDAFIGWSKLQNADRIQLGTMSGIQSEKVVNLYESLGFELRGYVLEMEV